MKDRLINYTNTIRFKLIVIFTILFFIPFLLVETVIYRTIEDRALTDVNEQMTNSLRLVSDYTTKFLSDIQVDFQNIIFQEDFILSLFYVRDLGEITNLYQLEATEKLSDDFESFLENDRVHSVYLFNENNHVFYDFAYLSPGYLVDDIRTSGWYQGYRKSVHNSGSKGHNLWTVTESIPNIGHPDPSLMVSYYTHFRSASGQSTVLSVNVDAEQLAGVIESLSLPDGAFIYIADAADQIVASNAEETIGTNMEDLYGLSPENNQIATVNGHRRFMSSYRSDLIDYHYVIDIPYSHIIASAQDSRQLLYGLYLGIILILLTMNLVIQRFLLKPINAMVKKMRHVEQGNFDITLPDNRKDELGALYRNFNDMTRNIHSLIEKNYVEALLRKQSDLNYIQTQLNEHFLYNTLDAIYSLILTGDNETAQEMLLSLSRFFRTTLNNGKQVITIGEIAEMLENYSAIMRLRNSGKYTIEIHVDDHVKDLYALKFLFQPILENAIIHGAGKRRGGGIIEVTVKEDKGKVLYSVWDNGRGIDPATLEKLNGLMTGSKTSTQSNYFALNNIVSQGTLFYKSEFDFHIESELNTYTKCTITLPKQTSPTEGASHDLSHTD